MAFNYDGTTFVSFAVYAELAGRDTRLFEANEALTETVVNENLALSAERILGQIRADAWWKNYVLKRDSNLNGDVRSVPALDPDQIIEREREFKDLNIAHCLSTYLYPMVADFGNETSSEVEKIKFYKDEYSHLYDMIIQAGDWYDFDNDATVEITEREPVKLNLVRAR